MIKRTTLLIMAAGIGSRFGGGIKQLEPVGLHNEIIMDYSIHDAIEAGFNKIVFIIRKDIEADFQEMIGNRMEALCEKLGVEVGYAFQDLNDVPEEVTVPADRKKPWGTGQAVLAAKELIHEPFMVINADDYYGKEAFTKIHEFLTQYDPEKSTEFCMAGFILKNTLSDNGGVTRGICTVGEDGYLTDVVETSDIEKTANGAAVNGVEIDADSYVSMNMWGLTPEFLPILEKGFVEFFEKDQPENPLKAEYLLPIIIGQLLRENKVSVKVLETADKWFGVTYKEDKETVVQSFKKLIEQGVYKEELFSDLK
ncbi:sugar phosphate nucleotidyltransferase [Anaerostipes sp.]|uniref:sugar phosphate nucleotidyltransferase n=1 Tax=Anaerostipes sp. TaxID=1872530 RepID=UPI002587485D|nr:sugar phosphate nucleotidyltransferase [Anaerostipes sp.]MCI5622800.1 nucleotidyltransferase [Anaerostipes sp.]MDY2727282.1 sugar phosphate nucleotidyltransferase [Anaerostipes faecalis]